MLGSDSSLLTESEDVGSKGLFEMLNSKAALEDEGGAENSELKYLRLIQEVRDKKPEIFEKIKSLPRKARSARQDKGKGNDNLITYFRKGYLTKFILSDHGDTREIDFIQAAKTLECKPDTKREILTPNEREKFYEFFERNRSGFGKATQPIDEEAASHAHAGSRSSLTKLREFVKIVRKDSRMTDFDLDFLNDVLDAPEMGVIPKNDAKKIVEKIESAGNDILKYLSALREGVKPAYLGKNTKQDAAHDRKEKREIVLSLYRTAG